MGEHHKSAGPANPKRPGLGLPPRGLSRGWLYEQLAAIHSEGLDAFEAVEVARPLFKRLSGRKYLDLMERNAPVENVQAADVARVLAWRHDYLRYIVETGAAPETPPPNTRRIATAKIRPELDKAEREHKGAASFNRLLAERTGIPLHTVRRIRRGARKWLADNDADKLLTAARITPDVLREATGGETSAAFAQLEEELRPILRLLALAALRGDGDYSDKERQALLDFHWTDGADWPEEVVPLFTLPQERNEIVCDLFYREHGRSPSPIPTRVRRQALSALRERQKRERADLAYAEKAIGRFQLDAARVGELTRGARRAGNLPPRSKPRGYPPEQPDKAAWPSG